MLYNLLFTIFVFQVINAYTPITKTQWSIISRTLQTPKIHPVIQRQISHFLFTRYQPLVHSQTFAFSRFHKKKCRYIDKDELLSYANMGLYMASIKYNGNSSFTKYACTYIKGSLYKCLTKNAPISKIPEKKRRMKAPKQEYNYETLGYVQPNIYLGSGTQINAPTMQNVNEFEYDALWKKINEHPNLTVRRIFHYKFDYYFNVIRSNKHISFLMCCTEENIRKHVSKNIIMLVYNKSNYTIHT